MQTLSASLTAHASTRAQQRGVSNHDIALAIEYGDKKWSHGDRKFLLTDRALRKLQERIVEKGCDRLRGLCVIVTANNSVRTVKWDFKCANHPGVLRGAKLKSRWKSFSDCEDF